MLARLGPRASAVVVALVVVVLAVLAVLGIIEGAALLAFLGGLLLSSPPDIRAAKITSLRRSTR